MENLVISLNAIMPFIIYIAFGYGCKCLHVTEESFLKKLNQMLFKVFFPFLTFNSIYKAGDALNVNPVFMLSMVLFIFALVGMGFVVVPRLEKENARRGVIIQALFRSNMVLFALPLTQNLFPGEENTATAALAISTVVPIYNVIAVIVLEYYNGGNVSAKALTKKIVTNPLIDGAVIGMIFHLLHIKLPGFVMEPIAQMSALTTPLALFILGGTLHFSSVAKNRKSLTAVMLTKLVLLPAFVIAFFGMIMGFRDVELFILFAMAATPVAVSSYTMAASIGGDDELAGEFVMFSTVISAFTLFLFIWGMKTIGLI